MNGAEAHPARSEATRLLCAGVRLNAAFRQRVVDELIGHAERPVPPSLGVDLRPVLAHALHARRRQVRAAVLLLLVWVGFFLVSAVLTWDTLEDSSGADLDFGDTFARLVVQTLSFGTDELPEGVPVHTTAVLAYAVVAVALWAGRALTGRESSLYGETATTRWPVRSPGRVALGRVLTWAARAAGVYYWLAAIGAVTHNPYPVIFPLLLTAVVWWYRIGETAVLRRQLGPDTFADAEQPSLPPGEPYARVDRAIAREQHARATLYDPRRPFVGAGRPRRPWSLSLELRPRKGPGGASGVPAQDTGGVEPAGGTGRALSARQVVDMVLPRLAALRDATARTSKDRLRALEVDEFVYLPAGVGRETGVYEAHAVDEHLAEAVDEGGEARRHFLRVRVGAWWEQVVVSVLVRVHTQGGMLVLEVAPHVLGPVAEDFRGIDKVLARKATGPFNEGFSALLDTPVLSVDLGVAAMNTLGSMARTRFSGPDRAAPDAPRVSLREVAATDELSLFEEMDVSRYVKTVQDRIASGVRDALEAHGYRTDRFEQHIVHVQDGGVFIGEMSGGAVATGEGGTAEHVERSTV